MSSVQVVLPIGDSTFPRAVADVFEHDVLTITSITDDTTIRHYAPGTWLSAVVYGENDHILYAIECSEPSREVALRQREDNLTVLKQLEDKCRAARQFQAVRRSGDPRR